MVSSPLKTEYSYNFIIAGWNVVKIPESRRPRCVSSDSSVSDGSDCGPGNAGHHAQEPGHHGAVPGVTRLVNSEHVTYTIINMLLC